MTRKRHNGILWNLLPVAEVFFFLHSLYFYKFSKFYFHNTKTLFMKTTTDSCLKASVSYLRERRQPLERASGPRGPTSLKSHF